jgi:hypothetical protein
MVWSPLVTSARCVAGRRLRDDYDVFADEQCVGRVYFAETYRVRTRWLKQRR